MGVALVLLSAGNSSRFNKKVKKQWLRVKDDPLWYFVLQKFQSFYDFAEIVIVGHKDEINYMDNFIFDDVSIVAGGDTRQESLQNAISNIQSPYVMVSDIARVCVDKTLIKTLIKYKNDNDLVVPFIPAIDTTLFEDTYLNRDNLKLIQTPQISNTKLLKKYLKTKKEFGDESSLFKANNAKIKYIKGSDKFIKLTTKDDIAKMSCLKKPSKKIFNGIGFDLHQTKTSGKMILAGVVVSNKIGLVAHSDGDVLVHSIIDALLGACGAGDIGEFFPDNDDKFKDISSMILLEYIYKFITLVGYKIINIDSTIISEKVKISPFKKQIRISLAKTLNLKPSKINIKATTSEKVGSLGRNEAIAVLSTANLKFINWMKK